MSDDFDHGFREGVTVGALMAAITIGLVLALVFVLSGCEGTGHRHRETHATNTPSTWEGSDGP